MLPTSLQVRMARAALGWSQAQLAQMAGLSPTTIKQLESGEVRPHISTLEKLKSIMENAGLEFLENRGVALRNDTIVFIEGGNPYLKVLDDVYHTLEKDKGEVLFSYVDNSLSSPETIQTDLRLRQIGISFRHLIEEENTYLLYPRREYRYIPHRFFMNNTQVNYGDKIAQMIDGNKGAVIIRNATLAATGRNVFEYLWLNGGIPMKSSAPVRYLGNEESDDV